MRRPMKVSRRRFLRLTAGGPVHMTGELFMMMTGIKLLHVPYRGETMALADLLGDHVQVVFGSMPA
jgi:tripartite-type tricarboxylate transporter receptor subunit TctC